MMAVTALAIARIRNLFAVVMLAGVYSLLAAAVFVMLDAVDVAFTEAAVGAGISTVLLLGTLALTTRREKRPVHKAWVSMAVVAVTGAVLVYGKLDMPRFGDPRAPKRGMSSFGDPRAPANRHIAPVYIQEGASATGVPNLVTAVLASYRGYDTLGEVTVIFTAGIGVVLLLGRWRERREEGDEDEA